MFEVSARQKENISKKTTKKYSYLMMYVDKRQKKKKNLNIVETLNWRVLSFSLVTTVYIEKIEIHKLM